jgi:hypothetical protein
MNVRELRHKVRRLLSREIIALALLSTLCSQSYADINFGGAAAADYEYNTNVFDLPGGAYVPGATRRSDWFQAYGGTLQANDLIGQDKLYATLTGKDFRYDYFTYLNHAEYSLNGGFKWQQGTNLDGSVDVLRTRTMVPFTDVFQVQLALVTTQQERVQLGWVFIPDWRIQGEIDYNTVDQPEVNAPELALTEKTGQVGLQYIGVAGLSAGISYTRLRGDFSGADTLTNPNFDQDTLQFVVTYQPTASSTLIGEGGYSRRTSDSQADASSGPTGKFTYKNQLTPKTSVSVAFERDIINYITNSGSVLNTLGTVGLTWQATYRIGLTADYNYRHSLLPDQGLIPGTDRVDKYAFYDVKIDYQPTRWLWIEPYLRVQDRSSNYQAAQFNGSAIGVNFNLLWHCPNNRCAL